MIDSVIATKAMAQCGNPPFTVPALLNAEAVLLINTAGLSARTVLINAYKEGIAP